MNTDRLSDLQAYAALSQALAASMSPIIQWAHDSLLAKERINQAMKAELQALAQKLWPLI